MLSFFSSFISLETASMMLSFLIGMIRFSYRLRPPSVSSFPGSAHTKPTQIRPTFILMNGVAPTTHFTSSVSEREFESM
jgi:hypothetical protein